MLDTVPSLLHLLPLIITKVLQVIHTYVTNEEAETQVQVGSKSHSGVSSGL